jgi:hypothetical protein
MTSQTPPTTATTVFSLEGADDPDQLVAVAAGELFEWGWLAAELGDWLDHADTTTRADFDRYFDGFRSPRTVALFLAMISQRIAKLLDGDRGQP